MHDSATVPTQKNIVLLGAGNAHLRFVRMFGMEPLKGVAVTLISETAVIPYSAMVPGHIAGEYRWDEVTIDLVRLCRSMNVRFVEGKANRIDVQSREVHLPGRPPLRYDVLSLGVGSLPVRPKELHESDNSWTMRPLHMLTERLNRLDQLLKHSSRPFHLVIVGGGASGCELCLAIHKRFSHHAGFRLTLVQSHPTLLPHFPARAGEYFRELFQQQGITLRTSTQVTGGDAQQLFLNDQEKLSYDVVLWATNAASSELLDNDLFRCNQDGFLLVEDTLQSLTDPSIFGTGDCISITSHPTLLKNGVYAVREGGVLFENIKRHLHEKSLIRFRPQRHCLCLMNQSNGSAVMVYGQYTWKGKSLRWIKDRIDRAWIKKFTQLPTMKDTSSGKEETTQMRCGGCGSKISSDVLSAVLHNIDVGEDTRVLMGCHAGEDASVHIVKPELFGSDPSQLVEVQTVDYFKAFVDDPYLFGRIAALNAVSDIYAMNARPFVAMAIATLPQARGPVQEGMLHELLSGAVESLKQHGVTLTGGHTSEGAELALGFAVTGYGEKDRLFQKGKLKPQDRLVLTKPLGSGALLAAWMRGACRADWFHELIQTMLISNQQASEVLARYGVQACTDVTGFGFAGHLLEMLDASGVGCNIWPAQIPRYEGFKEVVDLGIVSSLHADNAKVACRVDGSTEPWLFDPQTSGGLLAGVPEDNIEGILKELVSLGYTKTAIIGEIIPLPDRTKPRIRMETMAR